MSAEWATVVVDVPATDIDLVSGLLWSAGVAGVEELAADGGVELRAGCARDDVDVVLVALHDRWPVDVEVVAADSGLDAWRDHAEAWRAGVRLVIVPPWLDDSVEIGADDIVLSIDPGHSFGSGSHTTTRDCLAALERLVRPGDVVADIGCGSGVLAIAAVLLGATRAVATDIDDRAIVATNRNAVVAGVADRVEVSTATPSHLEPARFDLVCANIGAGTLVELAASLVGLVRPGGVLVLSGILDERAAEVTDAYAAAGAVATTRTRTDGWSTIECHHDRSAT